MIYLLATVVVAPGKVGEFSQFLGNRFIPYFEKHGARLIGSWVTTIGRRDEVTDVWAFKNLAHYEEVMQTIKADKEFAPLRETVCSLTLEETTKIVSPLPCSPQ